MEKFLHDKKNNLIVSIALLVVAIVLGIIVGISFKSFSNYKVYFYESSEVTRVEKFSDYSKHLKGTNGDADIYVIDSGVPGASLLILGGTHPNEPSGQLTATVFLENLKVTKGKVYIVTEANRSAYTHSHPQEASPYYYTLQTKNGKDRTFKFGSRATNTNDQWPNPDIYVHSSGQKLTANDVRNLNRSYPGSEDGTFSERVAYAITNLIRTNNITMTIDLHEASPEYITINAMVYHQRAASIASKAYLYMDMNDVEISTEPSPTNLHGLTHRELGDFTDTLAFLCETSNAAQGKLRGKFTTDLILNGKLDKFYEKALELEKRENSDKIIYGAPTTIAERVARHTISIQSIVKAYNDYHPENTLLFDGFLNVDNGTNVSKSAYDSIMENGVGYYLHDPE